MICGSLFLSFLQLLLVLLASAASLTSPSNKYSGLQNVSSFEASKTKLVKAREENVFLQCPVLVGRRVPQNIVWLLPHQHVAVSEDGTSDGESGVYLNNSKYSLNQETGELKISIISGFDDGMYRCVVKQKRNQTCIYLTSGVNLKISEHIKIKPRRVYHGRESITRAAAAAAGVLFIFAILLTVHHFRWKKPPLVNNLNSREGDHEPSDDEVFEEARMSRMKLKPSSESYTTYSNRSFSLNSDQVYVVPEKSSRFPQPYKAATTTLMLGTCGPVAPLENLNDEDLDGLSFPLSSPPPATTSKWNPPCGLSVEEERKVKGKKRWWLDPTSNAADVGSTAAVTLSIPSINTKCGKIIKPVSDDVGSCSQSVSQLP